MGPLLGAESPRVRVVPKDPGGGVFRIWLTRPDSGSVIGSEHRTSLKEMRIVSTVVAVVIFLAVGLYVGAKVSKARVAHSQFSTYRHRTATGLVSWLRSTVVAALGIAGVLFTLFLVVQVYTAR